MDLVKIEIEVPKELNEIGDFVVLLLQKLVVEKLPIAEALASVMPAGILAVEGFQKVGEEAKSKEVYDFAALFAAKVAKLLVK